MLTATPVLSFSDPMPELPQLPSLALLSGVDDPGVSTAVVVVGTVGLLALSVVIGVFYNKWAYDDWTCMFKNCVQTSTKRGRR